MTQDYPSGSAPGSNKVVANPPSAGASQRRDRPRPTVRTAGAFLELPQCTLDGSLARAERTRERRGRPRLAALEQGEDGPGGTVDRRRQHDDGAAADGDEREAAPGRLDPGQRAQGGAQAAELDAEPGAVRLVGGARLEGALDEPITRHVGRPGLGERADEREQDRAPGERDGASRAAHRAPARVDDEVAGREQGLDLVEADRPDHPAADQARRGRREGMPGPVDLGDQGRDAGGEGGGVGAAERGGGVPDPDAAERQLGAGELGAGRERRRRAGGGDVDRGERPLGGRELADEEMAAGADEAGVEGVRAIAQRIERLRGRLERAHRPAQVTRGEGDLRLGDLAARLGEALAGAEAAGGAPEELARPVVVAELGHGAAAQGQGRRVVAQRDAIEGAEGITGRQRARGRGDEGVHVGGIHVDPVRRSTGHGPAASPRAAMGRRGEARTRTGSVCYTSRRTSQAMRFPRAAARSRWGAANASSPKLLPASVNRNTAGSMISMT